MRCLGSSRFNMLVDVVKPVGAPLNPTPGNPGTWVTQQDPDSGAVIRVFIPDNLTTPNVVEGNVLKDVRCMVRGVIDGGIRVAGTTERFSEIYESADWSKITFPPGVPITKRDVITNIRDLNGNIIWREEEIPGSPPTTFNVMGVTPIVNPFGRHSESLALLERAEVQLG